MLQTCEYENPNTVFSISHYWNDSDTRQLHVKKLKVGIAHDEETSFWDWIETLGSMATIKSCAE